MKIPFLSDLEDYIMLSLHTAVVGLHLKEFTHVNSISVSVLIGGTYMCISSLEAFHIKKKIKKEHNGTK